MDTINQETNKKVNKYLLMNSVKGLLSSSTPDKKKISTYKVSDKALQDNIYRWDPSIRQLIRFKTRVLELLGATELLES